ncbi:heterochromatin protein 1-binding protein 3 [Penaeus vannamei]|uniref:Putative heterochromatin protein 1-binding protein 3 isoform X8 n=1 Tax=Penaeus vannamei TaxID=6689 RepID=A0A423TDM1_PENVA|nr:histone H1-like [Penaeus vannamei]XP_027215219.1 histone H1-like [Penaeus vannamei]ROT74569.1 putative heterochromatin protein 1-binding protein 3 isoform X8 [Penaeus vannamei]
MAPVAKPKKAPRTSTGPKKRGRPKGSKNKVAAKGPSKVAKGTTKAAKGNSNPVKFAELVLAAFEALDNRKGTSLQAVKKYLKENNNIDARKKSVYINKVIKNMSDNGIILHVIGKGARGSFKLANSQKFKHGNSSSLKFSKHVLAALEALDNRKGCSLQDIKKYLKENKGVDPKKKAVHINNAIRALTQEGKFRQVVGTGAKGRFRLQKEDVIAPSFSDLVFEAFKALDNRKGSTLQAVRKYLKENNGVDPQKKAVYINKTIRRFLEDGTLQHLIGSGVKGTFKLCKDQPPPRVSHKKTSKKASKEEETPKEEEVIEEDADASEEK